MKYVMDLQEQRNRVSGVLGSTKVIVLLASYFLKVPGQY